MLQWCALYIHTLISIDYYFQIKTISTFQFWISYYRVIPAWCHVVCVFLLLFHSDILTSVILFFWYPVRSIWLGFYHMNSIIGAQVFYFLLMLMQTHFLGLQMYRLSTGFSLFIDQFLGTDTHLYCLSHSSHWIWNKWYHKYS
jgi:hypothetical protein